MKSRHYNLSGVVSGPTQTDEQVLIDHLVTGSIRVQTVVLK